MTIKNPKFENSNIIDCKPQRGLCPNNCNQCFYNRPDAFYADINEPIMPTLEEVGDKIVRVNSGHDSNIDKDYVIKSTEQYARKFFNTSVFNLDFPAPVVFTANAKEEERASLPKNSFYENLMFVRLRVSSTNLNFIDEAVKSWTHIGIPIVLTFMAYYEYEPIVPKNIKDLVENCYQWKVRTLNPYWCATSDFITYVLHREKNVANVGCPYLEKPIEDDLFKISSRLVSICGGKEVQKCFRCKNCETYYWQTMKRLIGE